MKVTITGADNKVSISELEKLSYKYWFVEWGILFSQKNMGKERYPTLDWINDLLQKKNIKIALHLCGKDARDVIDGKINHIPMGFRRVQINGYRVGQSEKLKLLNNFVKIILQCRTVETLPLVAREAKDLSFASVLFDPSGGRGVETVSWPDTPINCHLGFAGGINPDNVIDVLNAIGPRDEFAWIDMETGIRTDDQFDMNKVVSVLEQVKAYNTGKI